MRAVPVVLALATALATAFLGGLLFGAIGLSIGLVLGLVAGFAVVVRDRVLVLRRASRRREEAFRSQLLGASPSPADPPRVPWLRLVPQQLSVSLADVLARIERRSRRDLPGALAEAERLGRRHPQSPAVHRLLTALHARAGFHRRAAEAASRTIRLALHRGDTPAAVDAYRLCRPWREHLDLDPESWDRLGRLLVYRDDLEGAAWAADRAQRARSRSLRLT